MSEPKFTKGPWYAYSHDIKDCLDEYYTEWGVSSFETKRGICTMLGADSEDEINANAALMAAAPELYDFVHFFETFAGQCYCRILGETGQKIYDEAVKLCKKARGEE